ncbi:Shedu anti-phage system protein SduA [Bacillus sp. FJAT-45037]|uniref:Shedu anti-phage system protein SduA n=1 Tax=Bacillus sp. FJAT-45037 TaxID=2011007 RepID=UPI000C234DFC|nr:Shedu anti-phage system protein SduA [Bacillus sp. FJAT-45037]
MNDRINVRTTSSNSAVSDDIELKKTTTTRLIFRPEIVNNNKNPEASVRGCFIFQKKGKNASWEDYKELELSKLKATEWIKLELNSEAMLTLTNEIQKCYAVHEKYGVMYGEYHLFKNNPDIDRLIEIFESNTSLFTQLMEDDKSEVLEKALAWIVTNDNPDKIIDRLKNLQEKDLDQLNTLVGLANLKKILSVWEGNKCNNTSEKFWQDVLKENSWILSQIFSNPTVLINDEAYVGGKTINNDSGKLVDFLYANPFSKDAVLIEIKTPSTPLITPKEYRTGVYSVHKDLTGAVTQVLTYKTSLQREYQTIDYNNYKQGIKTDFDIIHPCCVVIAGRFDTLTDTTHRHSFELYRKELKNVTVITFDELFEKVKSLIQLLEG